MVNNFIAAISHFFAENKSLSYLLLVSIAVFGAASFMAMPKQYNPEIIRPAFVVSFAYEGAMPETTLDRVGYELVQKLQVVPGVEDIYTKITDGSLVFSSAESTPAMVREQVLSLREAVLTVPGVSELSVVGGEDSVVMVEVDPSAMLARGVSLDMVEGALTSASLRVSSGEVEGSTGAVRVVLEASATTVSELGELPVAPGVTLREVASVFVGASPQRSYTWYASKDVAPTEVVMLSVAKREGSSAPTVTTEV